MNRRTFIKACTIGLLSAATGIGVEDVLEAAVSDRQIRIVKLIDDIRITLKDGDYNVVMDCHGASVSQVYEAVKYVTNLNLNVTSRKDETPRSFSYGHIKKETHSKIAPMS